MGKENNRAFALALNRFKRPGQFREGILRRSEEMWDISEHQRAARSPLIEGIEAKALGFEVARYVDLEKIVTEAVQGDDRTDGPIGLFDRPD
jgi:hypothetical protein